MFKIMFKIYMFKIITRNESSCNFENRRKTLIKAASYSKSLLEKKISVVRDCGGRTREREISFPFGGSAMKRRPVAIEVSSGD